MAEMSPLRRRMTEDMTVRNLLPATQRVISDHRGPQRHVRSPLDSGQCRGETRMSRLG